MKKLILDYSKWRCGNDGDNKVGKGQTQLLNKEGYMCCLGQFALQLNDRLAPRDLLGRNVPSDIPEEVSGRSMYNHYKRLDQTELSREAIRINDHQITTPEEKIEQLKKLFAQHDFEIEVINKP